VDRKEPRGTLWCRFRAGGLSAREPYGVSSSSRLGRAGGILLALGWWVFVWVLGGRGWGLVRCCPSMDVVLPCSFGGLARAWRKGWGPRRLLWDVSRAFTHPQGLLPLGPRFVGGLGR